VNGTALWLRADAGVHGGTNVSQWDDQSGHGRNATQALQAYRPIFVGNDAPNGGNFNPTLHYTSHFMDVSYTPALNGANLTVFVVVDLDGGSSWRSPWTSRDDYPSRGYILYYNGGYRYLNGDGTNGGWHLLKRGNTSQRYEIVTTASRDVTNNRIQKNIFLQGRNLGTQTVRFGPNARRPFRIGRGATESSHGNFSWYGDISEIIAYPSTLSEGDRKKVESYLAIKYGITLDQFGSGKDYHDSNSHTVWSASNNTGYGRDIAGLGRDDVSVLDQRISHSIDPDGIVTMATSSDFSSANTNSARPSLGSDRSFLLWSNDNGGRGWTTTGAPASGKILSRRWKVQKSGAQNSVSIQVDVDDADFDIDPFVGTLCLAKGVDLAQAVPMPMIHDGQGKWHIENINFADGDLFGLVVEPRSPVMHITKTSCVIDDPVNTTTHPKRIPGATIRYAIEVNNTGTGAADHVSVEDNLSALFDEHTLRHWQVLDHPCNCTGVAAGAGGVDGNVSGRTITLDFGTLPRPTPTQPSVKCGYFEVQLR
jgi:uncharacterized repeat protein (TIGR01451 family)